jgi:hypothetical protein
VFILEIDLASSHFSQSYSNYLMTRRQQMCGRKGEHSRSVRKDHGTLDFRHEVSSQHPVYLRVADIFRGGGRRSQDATPRASARASHSFSFIYIGRYMLSFRSFCMAIHSHRQARSEYSDCDVHPLAIHQSTEFIFIGIIPQPRFI